MGDTGPTVCQGRGNCSVYLAPGATYGASGVFNQNKSDTVFRSTVSGRRHLIIFPAGPKKRPVKNNINLKYQILIYLKLKGTKTLNNHTVKQQHINSLNVKHTPEQQNELIQLTICLISLHTV